MARDIDKILGALSSPVRREILALIWDRELPAGQIAAAFELTKPTISQHLAVLRETGLVTMTVVGTSRRYRARPDTLSGLHGALESATKWLPADQVPERGLAVARASTVVVVEVDVDTDQATTFAAFTDPVVYSRWLGAPVRINGSRFAATMEWGTEVRGTYEVVSPPDLIVMRWDLDDHNPPVPGQELTGYLRVRTRKPRGAHVEVHQLVSDAKQAQLMEAAWKTVLGRLKSGVVDASKPETVMAARPPRAKRHTA
jgi:DNA-binding transcriptional ArsR family regulator